MNALARAGLVLATALSLTRIAPAPAEAVVIPGALEFVEGNSDNCAPASGCADLDRYQQVFDASEFTGTIDIGGLVLRRDAAQGAFSVSFSDVTLRLSTTSAAVDGLSTSFAANQGADLTVVRSGALTLTSPTSTGAPAPLDPATSGCCEGRDGVAGARPQQGSRLAGTLRSPPGAEATVRPPTPPDRRPPGSSCAGAWRVGLQNA